MLKENKTPLQNNSAIKINNNLFGKQNYIIMLAGLLVIALGFVLMTGGKSADPNVFDPKEVYSTTRITIAPILIISGFILEIIGILKKPQAA